MGEGEKREIKTERFSGEIDRGGREREREEGERGAVGCVGAEGETGLDRALLLV